LRDASIIAGSSMTVDNVDRDEAVSAWNVAAVTGVSDKLLTVAAAG